MFLILMLVLVRLTMSHKTFDINGTQIKERRPPEQEPIKLDPVQRSSSTSNYTKLINSPYVLQHNEASFLIPYLRIRNSTTLMDTYIAPVTRIQTIMSAPTRVITVNASRRIDHNFISCGDIPSTTCIEGSCNGDSVFCASFKCQTDQDQICHILESHISFEIMGQWSNSPIIYNPEITVSSLQDLQDLENTFYQRPKSPLFSFGVWTMLDASMRNFSLPHPIFPESPELHVNDGRIHYHCPARNCLLKYRRRQFVHHVVIKNMTGSLALPMVLRKWRTFQATILSGNHTVHIHVTLDPLHPCRDHSFLNSYEEWKNQLLCYQDKFAKLSWYLFILACIILGTTMVTLMSRIWFLLRCLFSCLVFFVRILHYFFKRGTRSVLRWLLTLQERRPIRRNRLFQYPVGYGLALLCIVFLSPFSEACTDAAISTSEIRKCLQGDQRTTCKLSFDTTITLPDIDHIMCLHLHDDSGDPLHDIVVRVNYTSLTCRIPTVRQYYTRNYTAVVTFRHSCTGANTGCQGDVCLQVQPNDNPAGHFDRLTMSSPGISSCQEVPGGWSNTCFLVDNSCLFIRKYLSLGTEIYEVRKPTGTIHCQSDFEVTWTGKTGRPLHFQLEEEGEADHQGMSVSFIGRFDTPTIILGENAIVKANDHKWWTQVSISGDPQAGLVGDLQTSSEHHPKADNSVFSKDIFKSCNIANNRVKCVFGRTGITNLLNLAKPFPYILPDYTIDTDNDFLIFKMNKSPAVQLRLMTPDFISITRTTREVCPKGSYRSTSGCHSCPLGVTIVLSLYSTCFDGMVRVSYVSSSATFTLTTTSLYITRTEQTYDLFGHSSTNLMDGTLSLRNTKHFLNFTIKDELEDPILDIGDDVVLGESVEANANTSFKLPWFPTFWPSFTVITLLFIVVGFCLILPLVINVISRFFLR